jgi:hypothetical protein
MIRERHPAGTGGPVELDIIQRSVRGHVTARRRGPNQENRMKGVIAGATLAVLVAATTVEARVVRLRIERREPVLSGRAFGSAGPYEKLVGKVDFAVDPRLRQNRAVVDLERAPANARGEVEFSADFYLLTPVNPARGNGRLIYEVGNRGGKSLLATFQKASPSLDPTSEAEFGNGALMRQGFSLLWMGWQWDVPERPGIMRMQMPVATDGGRPIVGLVRSNIIVGAPTPAAPLGDRGHTPYPVLNPESGEHVMLVRELRLEEPRVVPRDKWRFVEGGSVALEGGFEPGLIYDVVYRGTDPRVVGLGLAGTRDLISFFKHETAPANPMAGIRHALGVGVSQSGRFLRHLVYQGFNEDEAGRRVFDGLLIQVAGAGRGSFNHRFAQASRDGYRHLNLFYPTDLFPFTDAPQSDPETGEVDGLLGRAAERGVVPKIFHVLGSFEYWNRAGSLIHTDPDGVRDAEIPETSRIYSIASAPHSANPPFPPGPNPVRESLGQAPMNPNAYVPVIRALFHALDAWVARDVAPPPSRYPRFADGTITRLATALDWPTIPGSELPFFTHDAYRMDYGPRWKDGIIDYEPPRVGHAFGARVPVMDEDGNEVAGIRMPEIAVPLASQTGWNFRHPDTGARDELAAGIGAYFPFPRTRAERKMTGDSRKSIEERYRGKDDYLARIAEAARELVEAQFLLPEDVPDVTARAAAHYDWVTRTTGTTDSASSR